MKKVHKNPQKSTILESINRANGLTPIQEQAAVLLVSGKNITDVSNELNIDRGTLYKWLDKVSFKAYLNRIYAEIKAMSKNRIFGLYSESLKAFESSLKSDNETIKLKAAIWLIERVEGYTTGQSDPRGFLQQECTESLVPLDRMGMVFNKGKYNRLCLENDLDP